MSRIPSRTSKDTNTRTLKKISRAVSAPSLPFVKSIQKGEVQIQNTSTQVTDTLSAEVVPEKSLIFIDSKYSSSTDLTQVPVPAFVNGTTVRFTRSGSSGVTDVTYQIIEFN